MTQQWNFSPNPAESNASSSFSPARRATRCLNGLFSLLEMLSVVPERASAFEFSLSVAEQPIGKLVLKEGKLLSARQSAPSETLRHWRIPRKQQPLWERLQQGLAEQPPNWIEEALAKRMFRLKEVRTLWPLVLGQQLLQIVLKAGQRPVQVRASHAESEFDTLAVSPGEILLRTAAALDSAEPDSATQVYQEHCRLAAELGADYVDYGEAAVLFFKAKEENMLPIPLAMRGLKRDLSLAEINNLATAARRMSQTLQSGGQSSQMGVFTFGDDSWICHVGQTRLALIRETDRWNEAKCTLATK